MTAATIKLFLPLGDPQRLRTAEISNWNGKAIAAPRTELDLLLLRSEVDYSGVYILTGVDALTGKQLAYIGEAEVIRDRIKQHKTKEFWVQAIVFISKDENLTKAHIRYLEGRLIEDATKAGRAKLTNGQTSGSKLPESDREDMEVFLSKIHQLLPVLGSDIITPVLKSTDDKVGESEDLNCTIKGLKARGRRTPAGFVVFEGSQSVLHDRPSAQSQHPYVVALRQSLQVDGTLAPANGYFVFTRNAEFTSPSAAASVIRGGGSNGLIEWRDKTGRTLKELEGG